MITVFTPSYNREKELKQLYKSLLKQDFKNFEWLIIDDGSKDNTKEIVKKWKAEKKIKINYVYKTNGGKQSAYNLGLDKCKGDIFLCIDSDDVLKSNILNQIENDFKNIVNDNSIAGIAYLQSYISNKKKIIGSKFPTDDMICSYYEMYNKHKVTGDKLIVLKTSVAKKYYFPMIEGEKFVPEALIFNRISNDYKLLFINKVAAHKEYLEGGYSNNYFNLVKRNPKGNALYFKEAYDFDPSIYNLYGYILFSIYAKNKFKAIYTNHKAKFKIICLYIPTLIISKLR